MGTDNNCGTGLAGTLERARYHFEFEHDSGNVSVNTLQMNEEGRYRVLYASNQMYRGSDRIDISFIDTDNDPTTFEGIWMKFSGERGTTVPEFFKDTGERRLVTDTARELLTKEREVFLKRTCEKGTVKDLSFADLRKLIGIKPDGSPRKIVIVIPHQDDEIGIAGTISRYIKLYGAENVMVLFTTNGDGLAWDAPVAEREEYGRKKMALGRAACARLGIPPENVRMLETSEVEFYNSFISDNLKKADQEGKKRPKDVQPDFRYIDDALQALYYQVQWIYRNIYEFQADVVMTSDLEYTVQMHDWTAIMTRLAVNQYAKERGGDVLQLAFPQQNVNPKYDDKLLYSYYPHQIALHGAMRVVLDDAMKKAKSLTIENYQTNATDRLLFVKYFFQFGAQDTARMKRYEYFHIVDNNDLNFRCPALEEQGYTVFEGNDEHMGVPHECERDDFGVLPRLIEYIREHPFTNGPIEPFNSELWYRSPR